MIEIIFIFLYITVYVCVHTPTHTCLYPWLISWSHFLCACISHRKLISDGVDFKTHKSSYKKFAIYLNPIQNINTVGVLFKKNFFIYSIYKSRITQFNPKLYLTANQTWENWTHLLNWLVILIFIYLFLFFYSYWKPKSYRILISLIQI